MPRANEKKNWKTISLIEGEFCIYLSCSMSIQSSWVEVMPSLGANNYVHRLFIVLKFNLEYVSILI